MRLTSLEIRGFKSFADKTVLHFNENITGIVGPNGCGKSNIVDAIRWVLGEQKASSLRSEKMENVIFNGSKKRKASSLAQVTLTFENTKNILPTEYSTVTISRELFRSGDSGYKLNDVSCRLKDIKTLFMDTGIGSDSYAIIELNRVDEILNDRENSRIKLFEQAAGISKFKTRKRETLNKLKHTETDLERVQDLLFEIENNLKTLEKQAKRTKKYYEIREQYKELSLALVLFVLKRYKEQFKTFQKNIRELEDSRLELQTEMTSKDASVEKLKALVLQMEKDLSSQQKEVNALVEKIQRQENNKNITAQKLIFTKEKVTKLDFQIEENTLKLEQTELDLVDLEEKEKIEILRLEHIENQVKVLENELKITRGTYGTLQNQVNDEVKSFKRIEHQLFELDKKTALLKAKKENIERELKRDELEHQSRTEAIEKFHLQQNKLVEDTKGFEAQKQDLIQQKEQLEQLKRENLAKQQQLDHTIALQSRTADSKENEYKLLKSLVDNLEGFPESIRFLQKSKKWEHKAPLLSDIFYCNEEYRIAIENYLEPFLNYYVVKNYSEAMEAIDLLKNASKGKANFFISSEFNDKSKETKPINGLNPALSVVEFEAEFQPIASHLLQNVYLTENSINDYKNLTNDIVVISKKGDFLRSNHKITGGAVGLFEGKKIGRKKQLEKLQQEIQKYKQELKALQEQKNDVKNDYNILIKKDTTAAIQNTERTINKLVNEKNSVQIRIENLVQANEKMVQKQVSFKEDFETIETNLKSHLTSTDEFQIQKKSLDEKIKNLDENFKSISTKLTEQSNNFNQNNIQFHQQQNLLNGFKRDISYKKTQQKSIEQNLANARKESIEGKTEIESLSKNSVELETILVDLYKLRTEHDKNLSSEEEKFFKEKNKIQEEEKVIQKINRNKQEVDNNLVVAKDKLNEAKIELNGIKERLQIEFKANINELINQEPDENWNENELQLKVERIKNRIDNYGEINPMAMEAFDEMKERHDFITGQKADLEEAKVSLVNTIKEIEEKATDQFLDAFTKVRENFQHVFRSLFTEEDSCDLILTDPENPLESKIDILAQPKGKRPQSINQLSGGEKTLTATALLFSLYLLKPAPFCIFDEVDAPLDDANIDKFNKIIHQFSKDSQFIIVTHNKQTMAAVDVIYGVTMLEMGVSRVVPVDFRNLN